MSCSLAVSVMFSVLAECAVSELPVDVPAAPRTLEAPVDAAPGPASAPGARIAARARNATPTDANPFGLTIGTVYPSWPDVYSSSASVGATRAARKPGTATSTSTIAMTSASSSSGRRPAVRVTIGKPVTLRR